MIRVIIYTLQCFSLITCYSQTKSAGLRGDSAAIQDAKAMVAVMGGAEIWSKLESIHFVHKWYPVNRVDAYIENEILDLTSPRSWVERKSEINLNIRAYSPEGKYWTINNGKFGYASNEVWQSSIKRAPFNFYHLIRAVAADDPFYELRYGKSDIPNTMQIEFYDPDGVLGGWIILNAKKEPVVKATPEYRYTLGPLELYGNLWIPKWGVYDTGYTRYEMISVSGSTQKPDLSIFLPPKKESEERKK